MRITRTTPWQRFALLLILSFALMLLDDRYAPLQHWREQATTLLLPVLISADLPRRGVEKLQMYYPDPGRLEEYVLENTRLKEERLALSAELQQHRWLEEQNRNLAELLDARPHQDGRTLVARLKPAERLPQQMMLDRGRRSGIYVGQAVLDQDGVIGQVSRVFAAHSLITPLAAPRHMLPVRLARTGLTTLVRGRGIGQPLEVLFLPEASDIRQGDLLVSSGLGGRFPAGFPVARVATIVRDVNAQFLRIDAVPAADLRVADLVLLLWPPE